MVESSDVKIERIAANAWFMVVGRAAMILTLPILTYFGGQISTLATKLEVLTVIVDNQGAAFKNATADIYRGVDAARDQRLMQNQIDDLKRRIDLVERPRSAPH